MGLGLYKKRFHMELEAQHVQEVIAQFQSYKDLMVEDIPLKTIVRDDGSLQMKFLARGNNAPPRLIGRIRENLGRVSLEGMVKESFLEAFTHWIFLLVSAIMAFIMVILMLEGSWSWLPLLVCGGGAVVFALIAYVLGKLRYIHFTMDEALLLECTKMILLPFAGKEDAVEIERGEENH